MVLEVKKKYFFYFFEKYIVIKIIYYNFLSQKYMSAEYLGKLGRGNSEQ